MRAPDLHKYDAGVLLVVASSERYRGAALLSGGSGAARWVRHGLPRRPGGNSIAR